MVLLIETKGRRRIMRGITVWRRTITFILYYSGRRTNRRERSKPGSLVVLQPWSFCKIVSETLWNLYSYQHIKVLKLLIFIFHVLYKISIYSLETNEITILLLFESKADYDFRNFSSILSWDPTKWIARPVILIC